MLLRQCVPDLALCWWTADGSPERYAVAKRETLERVEFRHPTSIQGVELPAGSYDVETEEEQIEALSFIAYRRVQTTIIVPCDTPMASGRQVLTIEPSELRAALELDAQKDGQN